MNGFERGETGALQPALHLVVGEAEMDVGVLALELDEVMGREIDHQHQPSRLDHAGGLGERLGFNGVKFALPADVTSENCVLGVYAAYIRTFEGLAAARGHAVVLPLVIMASADTFEGINALLQEHAHFGLQPTQVTILMQEKVAALCDNAATLAMSMLTILMSPPPVLVTASLN